MNEELCPNCGTLCLNNTIFCTPPLLSKRTNQDYIEVQVEDENNPPVIALLLTRGQIALLKYWFESHHAEGRDGDMDMEIYKTLCDYK